MIPIRCTNKEGRCRKEAKQLLLVVVVVPLSCWNLKLEEGEGEAGGGRQQGMIFLLVCLTRLHRVRRWERISKRNHQSMSSSCVMAATAYMSPRVRGRARRRRILFVWEGPWALTFGWISTTSNIPFVGPLDSHAHLPGPGITLAKIILLLL